MTERTRILVVEDNPGDLRLIRELLCESEPPCEIQAADRLSEAFRILAEDEIDLVLLDLSLPDSSGMEGFHRMRSEMPATPIIILTGLRDVDLAREAVRGGAQDFLVKGHLEGNLLVHAVRYAMHRHALQRSLEELSLRDPLTGLYNRRGFHLLAEQSLRVARRESLLLMADVDDLKGLNDRHGHPFGDQALCAVARALESGLRESDIVARLGGDEFVVLAVEASPPGAEQLVRRVKGRLSSESEGLDFGGELSISVGHAAFDPSTGLSMKDLMAQADQEMYREKRSGRAESSVRVPGYRGLR